MPGQGIEKGAVWLLMPLKELWEFKAWVVGEVLIEKEDEEALMSNTLGCPTRFFSLGFFTTLFKLTLLSLGLAHEML